MDDIKIAIDSPVSTPKGKLLVMHKLLTEEIEFITKLDLKILAKIVDEEQIRNEKEMAGRYQNELKLTLEQLSHVIDILSKYEEEKSNDITVNELEEIRYAQYVAMTTHSDINNGGKTTLRRKAKLFLCTTMLSVVLFTCYGMFKMPT